VTKQLAILLFGIILEVESIALCSLSKEDTPVRAKETRRPQEMRGKLLRSLWRRASIEKSKICLQRWLVDHSMKLICLSYNHWSWERETFGKLISKPWAITNHRFNKFLGNIYHKWKRISCLSFIWFTSQFLNWKGELFGHWLILKDMNIGLLLWTKQRVSKLLIWSNWSDRQSKPSMEITKIR